MDSATSGEPNLLLTCECEEFDIIIEELSAGEILNTITELHQETSRVQQNVTILQDQLKSFSGEKSSERYNSLYTEFKENQTLLAKLINKSMKCFAQHKQRKLAVSKGSGPPPTSNVKTEVQTITIPKTNQSSNSGTINHSNDKTEQETITAKPVKPITENKEAAKVIVAASNGISHNESGKKTSPIAVKSTKTSSNDVSGKTGGRKLIQEYSSKTQMDDIRAEIFKNVDKAAKENVSKLLVNNVAHIHNKDAVLRSKNDILAFKAEVESQATMENNLKEGKVSVSQNAQEETKNIVKVTVNKEEVKPQVVKVQVVKPEVKVEEVKPEVVIEEVKPEVVIEEVKPELTKVEEAKPEVVEVEKVKPEMVTPEVKVDEVKSEVFQSNGTLSPADPDFNFGYEKNKTGISVTEVTISSSSTDRSPEPRQRDAVYSKPQSTDRVEQEERMSSKNMLASASVLEKLLQGRNGGAVPEGPPVKNFVIKRKGHNGSDNKSEIPITKIETISESSATHDENNTVERDSRINEEQNHKSDSMTETKGDDEDNPDSARLDDLHSARLDDSHSARLDDSHSAHLDNSHSGLVLATTLHPGPVLATTLHPGPVLATTLHPGPVLATTLHPGPVLATTLHPGPVLATTRHPGPLLATNINTKFKS